MQSIKKPIIIKPMKKNRLFLILSVLFINALHAQDDAPITVVKNQFKINVLLPGFVYEHGFSAKNTLYSEASLGLGFTSGGGNSNFAFYPNINEQFRHYYNLEKRATKGKRTARNSGNFIAGNAIYNFGSISTNDDYRESAPSFTVAALWGLQRTYKGRFNLEFSVGPGVNFDKYDTEFAVVGNFTLGWVIGK
jgi:putative salt-induced outer membrane protein YdiY